MKKRIKTGVFAIAMLLIGSVFAAGHNHGDRLELGEQKSASWSVTAAQFGALNDASREMVLTLMVSSNGGELEKVETFRLWLGDVDSDALVNKVDGHLKDGKIFLHGHFPIQSGDDYSQFTLEVDDGSDEGEIITFKTK